MIRATGRKIIQIHMKRCKAARPAKAERAAVAVCLIVLSLFALPSLAKNPTPPASQTDSLEDCVALLSQPSTVNNDPAMPVPLRVVSWNTRKYLHPGAAEYLQKISSRLDMLMLQETMRDQPAQPPRLPERAFSPGYVSGDSISGVETRSHVPFDLQCRLQFLEPWLRTPKAVSVIRTPFRSQSLLTINIHAINFTIGSGAYAKQLGDLGRLLAVHTGPVLFGGDLNNWNPWRKRALAQFVNKHALHKVQFAPDWRSRHLGSPVDGIFLRGLVALDATALPTRLSDHNPVYVSMLLDRQTRPQGAAEAQTSTAVPVTIRP
ncbi:MAG: endonuclease/exonuclease/phosphatase family protein [Congregibacter sp.]